MGDLSGSQSSHFTKNAGTEDYVYGQTSAKSLAKSNPSEAIMNADSHEVGDSAYTSIFFRNADGLCLVLRREQPLAGLSGGLAVDVSRSTNGENDFL